MTIAPLRRLRSDAGSAIIELAVTLPILVLVLAATIDFARVFYLGIALTNAARAGAQTGAFNPAQSGNSTLMQTTAVNSVAPYVTGVTAAASRLCTCATDNGVFSSTSPSNTCTGSCGIGSHLVITVTVTTTKTFTSIMSGFPALPSSIPLTRSATMRVVQ